MVRIAVEAAATGKTAYGRILFDLQCAQGDTNGMVDTALRLVKSNPDDASSYLRLGEAYERAGHPDMARIAYSKAASGIDPAAASVAGRRLEAIEALTGDKDHSEK